MPHAHCIEWLQSALDYFHNELPWASRIISSSISIANSQATAPADFILDVKNGVILDNPKRRLQRVSYQRWLNIDTSHGAGEQPACYTVQRRTLRFAPAMTGNMTATLHYYQLPPPIGPGEVPDFPSDRCLIDFVRLMAWEWIRALKPGSALEYARLRAGDLQKAGLANEPEYEEIPIDTSRFRGQGSDRLTWLGS